MNDRKRKFIPDLRLSKYYFWFLFLMYMTIYMTKNCYSAAMASIVSEGVMTKSETGFISAMFYLVYTPLQVVGGVFADRYKPERLIKIGLIGGGIANAVIYFNQNYYVMLIAWMLNAVVQFGIWTSIFKIITTKLEHKYRQKAVFYISFSSSCGLLFAYVTAAFVGRWQHNFALSAILLFAFALVMQLADRYTDQRMVEDEQEQSMPKQIRADREMSSGKLFFISGFFTMLPVAVIRMMVDNGVKTLAPTMMMESYDTISPMIGNLLSTFIIIAGVIGTIIARVFICPRIFKNEVLAAFAMLVFALPFAIILRMVGIVSVPLLIAAMCVVSASLTSVSLFCSYMNMRYARYGKSGTAAGISNAAASFGVVLQSYGFVNIADNFGWPTVTNLWIIMLIAAAVCAAVSFPLWRKFRKEN